MWSPEFQFSQPGWTGARKIMPQPAFEQPAAAALRKKNQILTTKAVKQATASLSELYASMGGIKMPNLGIYVCDIRTLLERSTRNLGWANHPTGSIQIKRAAYYLGCVGPSYMEDNMAEYLQSRAMMQSRVAALSTVYNANSPGSFSRFGAYSLEAADIDHDGPGAIVDDEKTVVYSVVGASPEVNLYVAQTIVDHVESEMLIYQPEKANQP